MDAIKINLDDLTQEKLDEAMPHYGSCRYASPCIIGALIPEDMREPLDQGDISEVFGRKSLDPQSAINTLSKKKIVEFPSAAQTREAQRIQFAFDNGHGRTLKRLLEKRGLKLPDDFDATDVIDRLNAEDGE